MQALVVASAVERLRPHLSDAARAALLANGDQPADDLMVAVARRFSVEPGEDDFRRMGADLSAAIDGIDRAVDEAIGEAPGRRAVIGMVAAPLTIPLRRATRLSPFKDGVIVELDGEPDGALVVAHVRVRGADRPDVRSRLRALFAESRLHILEPGTLPPRD